MAQCKYCKKKGIFLSVNKDGLCKKCAPVLASQVEQSVRVIKESEKIVNESKNTDTVLSRYDTILSHLEGLIELDKKGIPTIDKSPTKLYNEIKEEKQKVLSTSTVDVDDVIQYYEFLATLSTRTPLEVLKHHGEKIKYSKDTVLPDYGDISYGIWTPSPDQDDDLDNSINKPEDKKEQRELEFLKKFRETYESNLSHDQKYEIISNLFEEYQDLSKLVSNASKWYLWELMEIPGISNSSAEVMYNEGFKTKDDVKEATDEELQNIPGIGPGRLKQIRAYFQSV